MTSAVVSTSAAQGRFFVFDEEAHVGTAPGSPERPILAFWGGDALGCPVEQSSTARFFQSAIVNRKPTIENSIVPAARLEIRPAPQMVSSGVAALDALTGGLPRGCLTEICGPASSGRTTVLLSTLAAATRRGEFCALVDASDALDPHSAVASGVQLKRLLWVRCGENSPRKNNSPQRHRGTEKQRNQKGARGCPILAAPFAARVGISPKAALDPAEAKARASEHRLEQVLRATDLLLESGGFGLIVLDLADLPLQSARRIPLTTWFRFRRAVEHTPTILVAIEQRPIAGSCSSLLLQLGSQNHREKAMEKAPTHARLLTGLQINAEIICSRLDRKPARSVTFVAQTAWAGSTGY